jgi:hypothetical protein
MGLIGRIRENE